MAHLPAASHQWLFQRLDTWLGSPSRETQTVFVKGGPGVGKTTLSANLIRYLQSSGIPVCTFFCSANNSLSQDPWVACYSLACQLASQVEGLRGPVLAGFQSLGREPSLYETCEELLVKPFHAAGDVLPEHIIVVVDGLDEGSVQEGVLNKILQVVGHSFPRMPEQVRPMAMGSFHRDNHGMQMWLWLCIPCSDRGLTVCACVFSGEVCAHLPARSCLHCFLLAAQVQAYGCGA